MADKTVAEHWVDLITTLDEKTAGFYDIFETLAQGLIKIIKGMPGFGEKMAAELIGWNAGKGEPFTEQAARQVIRGLNLKGIDPKLQGELKDQLSAILPGYGLADTIIALFFGLVYYLSYVKNYGDVAAILNERALNERLRPQIIEPTLLLSNLYRSSKGEKFLDEFQRLAPQAGYDQASIDLFIQLARQNPDVQTAITNFFRGKIDQNEVLKRILDYGFIETDAPLLIEAARPLPDAGTFIREYFRGTLDDKLIGFYLDKLGFDKPYQPFLIEANRPILAPAEAIQAAFRGLWTKDQATEQIAKNGYSQADSDTIWRINQPLLDQGVIAEAYRRRELTKGQAQQELQKYGLQPQQAEQMLSVARHILNENAIGILWQRHHLSTQQAVDLLRQLGYSDHDANQYINTFYQPLDPDSIKILYWRGEIDEAEANRRLEMAGFRGNTRDRLKQTWETIPGIQDIITIAVRDSFAGTSLTEQSDASKRYGYREDFPEIVGLMAEKWGMSRDWALKYWEAHWQIPNVQLTRELLYRSPQFDQEDAKRILKYLDYPPALLDQIVKILYQPVNRIDVRRIYSLGIFDRDRVKRAYLDLGYNDEDAEALTEFTIRDADSPKTTTARTQILNQLRSFMITEDEARQYLESMNFKPKDVDFFISLTLLERTLQEEAAKVNLVRTRFISHVITPDEAVRELSALGYSAAQTQQIINQWKPARTLKEKRPTKSELIRWFKKGYMPEPEFRDQLRRQGYSDRTIDMYLMEATEGK